jgi:antitoxin component YwqK of YwqJK toxin-antitoxin module
MITFLKNLRPANLLRFTVLLYMLPFTAQAKKLEDSIYVYINDSVKQAYKLTYILTDTSQGFVEAEYADFPGKKAFRANYYNSWRTGVYTSWYPDGKKMETIIYQKGKRNGEYTLYDLQGTIEVKGVYVNDIKDGFWIYKRYNFYGKYNKGVKTGTWKWKTLNGKRKFEYKNGKLVKKPQGITITIPTFILRN